MERKKLTIVLLCVGVLLVMLSGCQTTTVESDPAVEDEQSVLAAEDRVYITLYMSDEISQDEQRTDVTKAEAETDQNMTTTMVAAVEKESLSVETIVSEYNRMVVENLYGNAFIVNEVKEQDRKAWVDFDSVSVENLNIEPGYEGMLFYNLARSIDENLGDIDEIYFTMDNHQDFQLGHLWFEANKPFYSGMIPSETEEGTVAPE